MRLQKKKKKKKKRETCKEVRLKCVCKSKKEVSKANRGKVESCSRI